MAVLVLAGCGSVRGEATAAAPPSSGDADHRSVTVLAAASLTEPFTALAAAYERAHPGVDVQVSFGSSTTLAEQVAQGAPADILATAGSAALDRLPTDIRAGAQRRPLATNVLEIAVPSPNPGRVKGLPDLGAQQLEVVLCAASVPCGAAADAVLRRAEVEPHVVSREVDVRATLAKVRLGEADAALVYRSDVVSARGSVTGIPIPAAANKTVTYPLLILDPKPHTVGFADLATGPDGIRALSAAGFGVPQPPGAP